MSTTARPSEGTFIWREIMTPDVAASKRFYGEVFGWKFVDMPMGEFTYTLINNGETGVGGMAPLGMTPGAPPHWISTVCVGDTDAAVQRTTDAGGKVLMPAGDVEGYGRFAVVADPQGAAFTFMTPTGPEQPRTTPKVGDFCWEHLHSTDVEGAKAFYAKVLGWEAKAAPGGPGVFSAHGLQVASVTPPPQPGMPSFWLTYVVVDDLASARGRVARNGGKVISDDHTMPGIGSFFGATDNVGATLFLFKGEG